MRRIVRISFTVGLVFLTVGPLFAAAGAAPGSNSSTEKQLARVRQATSQLHSVSSAEAAGYVGTNEPCVEAPGMGAMGIHFVNNALIEDPAIDLKTPEILLYIPRGNRLRLIGVEYFKVDADQDLSTDPDRPSLFRRAFDGPMEGHAPGMPRHYDLHVWAWQGNPSGVFAQFNPKLDCPSP